MFFLGPSNGNLLVFLLLQTLFGLNHSSNHEIIKRNFKGTSTFFSKLSWSSLYFRIGMTIHLKTALFGAHLLYYSEQNQGEPAGWLEQATLLSTYASRGVHIPYGA